MLGLQSRKITSSLPIYLLSIKNSVSHGLFSVENRQLSTKKIVLKFSFKSKNMNTNRIMVFFNAIVLL